MKQIDTRYVAIGAVALVAGALVVSSLTGSAAVTPTESAGVTGSCQVDAQSYCTITHGLGVKPSAVIVQPALIGQLATIDPNTTTATTYRVRFWWHNGTTFSTGTTIRFTAHYDFTPAASPPPTTSLPSTTTPPASTPPVSTPPASTPPASTPPASTPPASTPPTTPPPAAFSVRVSGNRLIDGAGNPLLLRGVNRSGTQYTCQEGNGIFDGPSTDASIAAMKSWGINVVRVNGNEACALGINGVPAAYGGTNYINALKDYINRLHAAGFYVIMDLHHNGPGTNPSTDDYPMADRDHSSDYWTKMATALKGDPAVLFDLYNEPWPQGGNNAAANWVCIRDGGSGMAGTVGSPCAGQGFNYVAAGMQELLNAVRATGATNVVMVGGTNWAGYLDKWQDYKPDDPLRQLAASVHVYAPPLDSPYGSPTTWDGDIAKLALTTPVVAGEGMDNDCTHKVSDQWFPWAEAHGVSYVFWAWVTSGCASEPSLISNYDGTPTAYGKGLHDWLLVHPTP